MQPKQSYLIGIDCFVGCTPRNDKHIHMNSFYQLFLANFKMFYREKEGFFWTVLMPVVYLRRAFGVADWKIFGRQLKIFQLRFAGHYCHDNYAGRIYSLAYWMVDLKARGIIKRLLATPLKQWQLALSLVCARLV